MERNGEWNTNITLKGKVNPAIMELSETYLEISRTTKKTPIQSKAA
jgi:hypothetical protein